MAHAEQTHHNSATSPKTESAVVHELKQEKDNERTQVGEKPYSIYTHREKWFIVMIASLAALFSPLTANVYFPAIPTIASAFHTSIESINLSVTVYMVFQGISYWLLMLLRCIQSAGSASTVALGAGVIGDIGTPAERGGFFGVFTFGPQVGPALGPVIGSVLADKLGWRSIFWFLCIMSGICFALMLMYAIHFLQRFSGLIHIIPVSYPRHSVDWWAMGVCYRRLSIVLLCQLLGKGVWTAMPQASKPILNNPLRLFLYLDVLNLLVFNAVLYAVFYAVNTTISTIFASKDWWGDGIGSVLSGRMLDADYRRIKTRLVREAGEDPEKRIRLEDVTKEENFPVERTLLIDLLPSQSSSITACNNLVRCSLGALIVSVIDLIVNAMGPGWTYVLLAGICLACSPMIWLAIWIGPRCRAKRRAHNTIG
ncbi:major facilitator superfamily domain-containing protein [Suillus spraguei]|nr:major facilitator superfamily domain-containing protein [Suillus spraguei]